MAKIKRKDISKQLLADLIGKDSHRGVTLTYSWMANQVGHFSLGFIPTLLLFALIQSSKTNAAVFSALSISLFWLAFELYNFLGPLLKKKKSVSKLMYVPGNQVYHFTPAWSNIAFDTFTDLCFFWIGAWCASFFIEPAYLSGILIAVFVALAVYPVMYWFMTKMYLQTAAYPIQYRLSQWDFGISEQNKNAILNFVESKENGNHLIICGTPGKGKTSISIATATEISLKHNSGMYTTANKFISSLADETIAFGGDEWNWCNCKTLIIDDLNPSSPMSNTNYLDQFYTFISRKNEKRNNLEIVQKKNIIWVVSAESEDTNDLKMWAETLVRLGIGEAKISKIQL